MNEHATGPACDEMRSSLEEAELSVVFGFLLSLLQGYSHYRDSVLYAVRDRLQKWSRYGKVKRFRAYYNHHNMFYCSHGTLVKSSQIEQDLDRCQNDVNTVMERLHVSPLLLLLRSGVQAFAGQKSPICHATPEAVYGHHENESFPSRGKAGAAPDTPTAGSGRCTAAQRWRSGCSRSHGNRPAGKS